MVKRVRILHDTGLQVLPLQEITEFSYQPLDQFLKMFLPQKDTYQVVDQKKSADICFYSVQLDDENRLKDDELNVFCSLENMTFKGALLGEYKFYNKFKRFGSKKTHVMFLNDVSQSEIIKNKLIIPTINARISYFLTLKKIKNKVPFAKKKFALMISQHLENSNKIIIYKSLLRVGSVDSIVRVGRNIMNKSCFHSSELLDLFNEYKFIVVCENSHTPGYVTEKIFNCFLAGSIPIYNGAPNINRWINPNSMVSFDESLLENVSKIKDNEELFNKMLDNRKIQDNYNNIKINYDTNWEKYSD